MSVLTLVQWLDSVINAISPFVSSAIIHTIAHPDHVSCISIEFKQDDLNVLINQTSQRRKAKAIDLRMPTRVQEELRIVSDTVDRNTKRSLGSCKKQIESLSKSLDRYSRGILILRFKTGQIYEIERRIVSRFQTASEALED
jgi:hypothetical protein